ncbi:hypothetical protein TVAG_156010 [Trichomonas vaginalis G3]|uniref:Uncharacterized protein n=1 Tax=Trichomonas vaginalis (strain ATCC PRA-98 / G3) TaxID=412133 RepID=A2FPC4_TRIV3|nr:hypothetical protein TVAGG3_0497870 [Trichomonas vaginalis G3]EAX93237.1 hypothetical protein TVAG_156010 [Trichomonas vaginalis G3]KAI5516853.1 hypothetical protein TVAGG3_0497870 [Trichomonas vaginalis G3]|eukprot:XP_001306167.1 hypothetical protein [Trichomonas vaginalis G3]
MTETEERDEIFEAVSKSFDELKDQNPDSISLAKFKEKVSDYIEKTYPGKRYLVEIDEIRIDLKKQCEVYSTANVLSKGIFKNYDFIYQDLRYVVNIFIPYAKLTEEYSGKFTATIQD